MEHQIHQKLSSSVISHQASYGRNPEDRTTKRRPDLAISYALNDTYPEDIIISKDMQEESCEKKSPDSQDRKWMCLWRKREGCDLKDRADGDCQV